MDRNRLLTLCGDLDDIAFRMESSARLVLITHTAFTEGPNEPNKDDFNALLSIYFQQAALIDELRDTVSVMQAAGRDPDPESDETADVLRALHESFTAGKEGRPPRHLPDITAADPATRESMEHYREAMTALYYWGAKKAGFADAG